LGVRGRVRVEEATQASSGTEKSKRCLCNLCGRAAEGRMKYPG